MNDSKKAESKVSPGSSQMNLLMKVQMATKDWNEAPQELVKLRGLLIKAGFDVDWSPKKLGINMLTANKIRGMVLKRVLMKLYPFEGFWATETLDETLYKCLLVCQQLTLQTDRCIIWGKCSVDASYSFWKKILLKVITTMGKREDECSHRAKSNVIEALIASRGTDWDKQIARNFIEGLGNQRFPTFIKSQKSVLALVQAKQRINDAKLSYTEDNFRPQTTNQRPEFGTSQEWAKTATTTSLTSELKKESEFMEEILRSIEKYYRNDCALQIDIAFIFSKAVADLTADFEGYMTANNRGAFKDVDSLTNHTDKVIKMMSKLTVAYSNLFREFQKYFRSAGGGGDELSLSIAISKLAEFAAEIV